ncbi:M48 family metallopeptidase [Neisseria sp. Ec49-e6-T10]|uniref:M48 family metallopeptidase n=1 Tax=Neisseria sp. Ec49-e6-T10 TaxID=3140744 RepID=UPI003EB945D1
MNIKTLVVLCTALIGTTVLTGCQSTTSNNTTGNNRQQLLLIPNAQLNAEVAQEYKTLISQARQAKALNVPASYAKRVKTIFNRIVPHTTAFRQDGSSFNWEINVINTDEVNAWCAPGGKMVVYSGIIKQLNLTDDELAAIIGHEMAHALREHTREQMSQEMAKSEGLKWAGKLAGLNSDQMDLANLVSKYGFSLPFSRTMEKEADVIGLELMARAGYNPQAAVTLWEKMAKVSGEGSALEALTSTHPTNSARINEIKKRQDEVMPLYEASKSKKATGTKKGGKKR